MKLTRFLPFSSVFWLTSLETRAGGVPCRILTVLESSLEDILRTKRKYHGPGNGGPAGPSYHGNNKGFGMTRKRICQLEVVEKKSIYGMWMDPLLFVKVTLFDPRDIIVLANILDVSMLVLCCRLFVVGLGWVRLLFTFLCLPTGSAPGRHPNAIVRIAHPVLAAVYLHLQRVAHGVGASQPSEGTVHRCSVRLTYDAHCSLLCPFHSHCFVYVVSSSLTPDTETFWSCSSSNCRCCCCSRRSLW